MSDAQSGLGGAAQPAPGWLAARLPVAAWYRAVWLDHQVPENLPFACSFGAMVGVALAVLTLSGIWLGLAYVPTPGGAALSMVEYARNVPFGWLMVDFHRDGATMLFIVVYWALFNGMFHAAYRNRRELAWVIEIVRFAAFLVVGFYGFAMTGGPDAQAAMLAMAAHVATVPVIGVSAAQDFLGGDGLGATSVAHMTMAHVAIGFLVLLIAALGYAAVRVAPPQPGRLVPRAAYAPQLFGAFLLFALILGLIITVDPGLGYPVGPVLPDALAVPLQSVPPWYLLVFHGFARAGLTPGGGAFLTVLALVLVGALPWLDRGEGSAGDARPVYAGFMVVLALDVAVLAIAAAAPAGGVWSAVVDLATIWFFTHFLVVTPLVTMFERPRAATKMGVA
jgi:quinol-cytochrome oxidoreductase complex cytochrome b subunit